MITITPERRRTVTNASALRVEVRPTRCEHGAVMSELPDRGWAAFTEQGPWSLVRDDIRWMPIAGQLRAAAQAEVPVLTRERKEIGRAHV